MSASILGDVSKRVHQLSSQFDAKDKSDKETLARSADLEVLEEGFDDLARYQKDQKNVQDDAIFKMGLRVDRLDKRVFGEEKPILAIVNRSLEKAAGALNTNIARFTEKQEETALVVQ